MSWEEAQMPTKPASTGMNDADAFALPGPLSPQNGQQGVMTDAQFEAMRPAGRSGGFVDAAGKYHAFSPEGGSMGDDIAQNVATGLADIPGAIGSLPHVLGHVANWAAAKAANNGLLGDVPRRNYTGAELDEVNPITRHLPTAEDINKGMYSYLDTVSHDLGGDGFTPYAPTSGAGRAGQAMVTAAGAGALDPAADVGAAKQLWNIGKQALSGGAAEIAQSIDPDNPILGPIAAMLTHGALSTTGKGVAAANESLGRPFYAPTQAGIDAAGTKLAGIDNAAGAGIANPTAADILGQQGNVGATTGAIGTGQSVPTAMEGLQDTLATRQAALDKARTDAAAPFYAKFRAELPVIPENMPRDLAALPAFRPAIESAETDMLNGANKGNNPYGSPTTTYTDYDAAGDPVTRTGALTPDLLGRTARKLNIQAATARRTDSDSAAGLTAASSDVSNFLNRAYPNSYPAAQKAFADASRPLDVFDNPAVARAIDQNTNKVGTPLGYTQDPASLLNTVAKSANPGTVVSQFIDAAGGDPASVTSPIRQAIVGQLHEAGAIDPKTGEVNAKLLDQTVKPYLPTLGMYLPELVDQFGTAKAAQATLDNMRAQAWLAGDIQSGGMRNADGSVTGKSMGAWIRQNRKDLEQTQTGAAMMRLDQIQKAIGDAPGGAADGVAEEVLPGIISHHIGGSENAILTMMAAHKVTGAVVNPLLTKFRNAYSAEIERATTDPAHAQRIIEAAARRPGNLGNAAAIRRTLGEFAARALRAGAIASGLPAQQQ
jgi:hypothetical protein